MRITGGLPTRWVPLGCRPASMKPTTRVAETAAPDGAQFVLLKHDGEFLLYMDDRQIMTTTLTHSELLLADIGCAFKRPRKGPRILIGGLGLGFSLRRALEITDSAAQVVVAELLPEIVRWNKELLDGLNDQILTDPRTEVVQEDVFKLIDRAAKKGPRFDAILLDVDDGSYLADSTAERPTVRARWSGDTEECPDAGRALGDLGRGRGAEVAQGAGPGRLPHRGDCLREAQARETSEPPDLPRGAARLDPTRRIASAGRDRPMPPTTPRTHQFSFSPTP